MPFEGQACGVCQCGYQGGRTHSSVLGPVPGVLDGTYGPFLTGPGDGGTPSKLVGLKLQDTLESGVCVCAESKVAESQVHLGRSRNDLQKTSSQRDVQ